MSEPPVLRRVLRVLGTPAPQGSKRHVGKGRMVESSEAVGPWRQAVIEQAYRVAMAGGHFAPREPIRATIVFLVKRPPSAPKRTHPAVRPDIDKLVRATLDGLTEGGLLPDDGQVCSLGGTCKKYAGPGVAPGAWILLEVME